MRPNFGHRLHCVRPVDGTVHLASALAMPLGAVAGGYGAASVARQIGKTHVRRCVISVGLLIGVAMFIRIL